MPLLDKPMNIVLDTHAVKEVLVNGGNRQRIIRLIKEKCHFLIIPDLSSEFEVHVRSFLSLVLGLRSELRGKFIPEDKPPKRLSRDLRNLMKKLREEGCDKGDLIVAKVACKRSRERATLIVSDDECFHNALPSLRRYKVEVVYVEELLKALESG